MNIEYILNEVERERRKIVVSKMIEKASSALNEEDRWTINECLEMWIKVDPARFLEVYKKESPIYIEGKDIIEYNPASLRALAKVDKNEFLRLYKKGFNEDEPLEIRKAVVESLDVLAEFMPEEAAKLYEEGMVDWDENIKKYTAESLGILANINLVKFLELCEKGLNEEEPLEIRKAAAKSFGAIAGIELDKLIDFYTGLKDDKPLLRATAVKSLGTVSKINSDIVLEFCKKGLRDFHFREDMAKSLSFLACIMLDRVDELYKKDRGFSYSEGIYNKIEYAGLGIAESLGALAGLNTDEWVENKFIDLCEEALDNLCVFYGEGRVKLKHRNENVEKYTAKSLNLFLDTLVKINPHKFIEIYNKKGLSYLKKIIRKDFEEIKEDGKLVRYSLQYEKAEVEWITPEILRNLVNVMPEKVIKLYKKGMNNSNKYIRKYTAKSLGALAKFMPEEAVEFYKIGLNDWDKDVRLAASKSLGELAEINRDKFLELSEIALDDGDNNIREHAEKYFGKHPNENIRKYKTKLSDKLINEDKEKFPGSKEIASDNRNTDDEWEEWNEDDALDADEQLDELIETEEKNSKIDQKDTVESLLEDGLKHLNENVRKYATELLGALVEEEEDKFLESYKNGLRHWDKDVYFYITEYLGELIKVMPGKAPELFEIGLTHNLANIRIRTAFFLGDLVSLNPAEYLELFEIGMKDGSEEIRRVVAESLASLIKTINEEVLTPIKDEEYNFIKTYLEKMDFKQDKILEELKKLINNPKKDYKKLNQILEAGHTKNLQEIIELGSIGIEGYTILKKLGKGSYKKVYLARNNQLNKELALLITDLNEVKDKAKYYLKQLNRTHIENAQGEAQKLSKLIDLRCPHIPITYEPKFDKEKQIYYWTAEYVPKKLSDIITDKPLEPKKTTEIVSQIIEALVAAEKCDYFHGDLAFVNIGIGKDEKIKVLDWGLCSSIPSQYYKMDGREFQGCRQLRCPEVYNKNIPTNKADIWAIGIITYRLLTGSYPFQWTFEETPENLKKWSDEMSIEEKQYYEDEIKEQVFEYCKDPAKKYDEIHDLQIPKYLKNIILHCIRPEPEKRPSASVLQRYLRLASKQKAPQ